MKLEIQGDNPDQRAEAARSAVGCIFGSNTMNGPLRMAPERLRMLLTTEWPKPVLDLKLRPPPDMSLSKERVYPVTMQRLEVWADGRHYGPALQMDTESMRNLADWEKACG